MSYLSYYKTGCRVMDDQHDELLEIINDIKRSVDASDLPKLRAAFRNHFDHEEAEMLSLNYPYMKPHVREHDALIEKIDRMCSTGCVWSIDDLCRISTHHIEWYDAPLYKWVLESKTT